MKKNLLSATALLVIVSTTTISRAAQKCVNLDTSGATTCTGSGDYTTQGRHDWSVTCGTSTVRGVSLCGTGSGAIQVSAQVFYAADDMCWCKMTYPFVSKWISIDTMVTTSASYCHHTGYGCAWQCEYMLSNSAAFRQAMFSNPD